LKLAKSARVETPEVRITEMVQAGLLHLDLITYGQEPDGALAATIGDYPPIGSESSPIIQFFDSMGDGTTLHGFPSDTFSKSSMKMALSRILTTTCWSRAQCCGPSASTTATPGMKLG